MNSTELLIAAGNRWGKSEYARLLEAEWIKQGRCFFRAVAEDYLNFRTLSWVDILDAREKMRRAYIHKEVSFEMPPVWGWKNYTPA